jgi:catalase (peroxidase I)
VRLEGSLRNCCCHPRQEEPLSDSLRSYRGFQQGTFPSDFALIFDNDLRVIVQGYVRNPNSFLLDFQKAYLKMTKVTFGR